MASESVTHGGKSGYVPSLILFGGDENWNVLRPKKLIELLINGCIREWLQDKNILLNLEQNYYPHITQLIVDKYEWLYTAYYSQQQMDALKVGDEVDFRMDNGRYVLTKIIKKTGTKLSLINNNESIKKLHTLLGYDNEWIIDYSLKKDPKRFVIPKSISQKNWFTSQRFPAPDTDDTIFVNPLGQHPGWKLGKIILLDEYKEGDSNKSVSKQRLIEYEFNGKKYEWWTHLDDHEEIAQYMDQPKIWEVAFDSKPQRKRYGPFAAEQIRFIYHYNKYSLFKNGLFECKGEMKIKRDCDDNWTNVDETGIYLLMGQYCDLSSIETNKMEEYLKDIIIEKSDVWMYRTASYGSYIYGLYSRDQMIGDRWIANKSGIFIKRVGEKGWYQSTARDLTILFYHLSVHKDIKIALGIQYIAERMDKAHTQRLTPHFEYDEGKIIHILMKSMEVDQYYMELEKLGFKNADSIINDLETFILSDDHDYKENGSKIMQHFSTIIDGKEKLIKLGFVIYDSGKLMPVFKAWTDLLNKDYLEKYFSYARCLDHETECCCIIKRLIPLDLFMHLYNKDICYIPGQINKQSPYFITSGALINALPHYNEKRLEEDYKHIRNCIESVHQMVLMPELSDDDDDDDDDDNYDDENMGNVNLLKIFSLFDEHGSTIKCHVEDCHTMNRECFPVRTHKPYPKNDYIDDYRKRSDEHMIVWRLDMLHNFMHHIPIWYLSEVRMDLKLMDQMEYDILKKFIKRRITANEKYKGLYNEPEVGWHYDGNKVGWDGIADVIVQEKDENVDIIKSECMSFEEMDVCLDRYYKLCDRNDYFDDEEQGKLSVWSEENGFEFDDVAEEMDVEPEDCSLVEIDYDNGVNNFPLLKSVDDESMRVMEIRQVIKNCFEDVNAYHHGITDKLYLALCTLHQ